MMPKDGDYWFEQKRYGYGAGWPIATQGWLLLLGYLAVLVFCTAIIEWDQEIALALAAIVMVLATVGLIMVAKARTRGGWRWRWGDKD